MKTIDEDEDEDEDETNRRGAIQTYFRYFKEGIGVLSSITLIFVIVIAQVIHSFSPFSVLGANFPVYLLCLSTFLYSQYQLTFLQEAIRYWLENIQINLLLTYLFQAKLNNFCNDIEVIQN